jgi:hypothetical protein
VNHLLLKLTWCVAATAVLPGCGARTNTSAAAAPPAITATEAKTEPGVVELSNPKATRAENNLINFEIHYKFTSGAPVKNYLLEISFPDTKNIGRKPMENWELKPEGVIKTSVELLEPTVSRFIVVMSEADSPDRGYTRNSNELTGELAPLDAKPPSS